MIATSAGSVDVGDIVLGNVTSRWRGLCREGRKISDRCPLRPCNMAVFPNSKGHEEGYIGIKLKLGSGRRCDMQEEVGRELIDGGGCGWQIRSYVSGGGPGKRGRREKEKREDMKEALKSIEREEGRR